MSYSVDTSALLDAWARYYPPDVFAGLWEHIERITDQGRFLAIDQVLHDLEQKEDDLFRWVKAHSKMFVPLDDRIQRRAIPIINGFPSLADLKKVRKGDADPFVIALAQERHLVVVTAEHSKPSKPRIPDVCKTLGVECISLVELFRREGWRL